MGLKISIATNTREIEKLLEVSHSPYWERGLKRMGRFIQMKARKNAPRDTGSLEKSIVYDVKGSVIRLMVRGKAAEYANYMELGHYKPGIGTIQKGASAGRLFMTRAYRNLSKDIINKLLVSPYFHRWNEYGIRTGQLVTYTFADIKFSK